MGLEVFLYAPNIIGYFRLCLLAISWIFFYSSPWVSVLFYSLSVGLDFVDGLVARRLGQTSAFGAWLDVTIDVLGRGMVWCRVYNFGYLIASVEWTAFVCNHTLGTQWKNAFVNEPWFVKNVMKNGFRTKWGLAAICGIHVLPAWLYCHYFGILDDLYVPMVLQYLGISGLAACRALALAVEGWCIWSHILYLVSDEANQGMNGSAVLVNKSRESLQD